MCTNYVATRGDRLREYFDVTAPAIAMREQAYPGYLAPIIRPGSDSRGPENDCVAACFGLIPAWSRDGKNYRHCYNARSETVAEKPSFRQAWRQGQRCIIPADAIFEPNYESGRPVRWRINAADGRPFAIAGIWEAWRMPKNAQPTARARPGPPELALQDEDWLISFSMLTLNADQHPFMNRFHAPGDEKRSVAMLGPDQVQAWLRGSPEEAQAMLQAYEADRLEARPDPAVAARKTGPKAAPPAPQAQRKLL